jgi:hypothetical protein
VSVVAASTVTINRNTLTVIDPDPAIGVETARLVVVETTGKTAVVVVVENATFQRVPIC